MNIYVRSIWNTECGVSVVVVVIVQMLICEKAQKQPHRRANCTRYHTSAHFTRAQLCTMYHKRTVEPPRTSFCFIHKFKMHTRLLYLVLSAHTHTHIHIPQLSMYTACTHTHGYIIYKDTHTHTQRHIRDARRTGKWRKKKSWSGARILKAKWKVGHEIASDLNY